MSDRPDLRELLGDDVPEAELERLRKADEALRAAPPPPEVPAALTEAVLAIPGQQPAWRSRRGLAAGLALAAALAAAAFGVGLWTGGGAEEAEAIETIVLEPTRSAPEARMAIEVQPVDKAGNWAMLAEVSGLEPLPKGGYYEVWLTDGRKLAASCGRFVVDEDGKAKDVWLNAPYTFEGFDRWVVTAHLPGKEPSRWLLDGPVIASV